MSPDLPVQPSEQNIGNYLHTRRRKAGLSQREMGRLLGYADEGAVSRHEQSKTVPPLRIAIAYEIVFQNQISELFPRVTEKMKTNIEQRLLEVRKGAARENRQGWSHSSHCSETRMAF